VNSTIGTAHNPWRLATSSGGSEYTMHIDDTLDPPPLVCMVGKNELTYLARAIDDLHEWLVEQNDWILIGGADEQRPAIAGTVEDFGRSPKNPVGGWYGQLVGNRGRFGVYVSPVLVAQGRAEIEITGRKARIRAIPVAGSVESEAALG